MGSEMCIRDRSRPWNGENYPDDAYVDLGVAGLYDERDTVLELELF